MLSRSRTAPTHYPRVLFHTLRTAQLLSSIIVGAVMLYFMHHLRLHGVSLPWTFIVLFAVSLFTIFVLGVTIVLHCCSGLNPRLNLILNSGLLLPWTVGFALLSWWSSGTLSHVCNTANWHDDLGVMVCRVYKALFAFVLTGFVSTLAALLLDISVYRRNTRLGAYMEMADLSGHKPRVTSYDPRMTSPFENSRGMEGMRGEEEQSPHDTPSAYAVRGAPYATMSASDLSGVAASELSSDTLRRKDGYTVPGGQFEDDTGYHGAGGRVPSH